MLSVPAIVAALLVGLVIGVLSGMLGIGGGTVMIPVFKLGFGMAPIVCTATSLFAVILTAISGSITHIRRKTCVPRLGIALGLGGAITSPLGVWLASISPDWAIMTAATIIIVYSAFTMFQKALKMKPTPTSATTSAASSSTTALTPTPATTLAASPSAATAGLHNTVSRETFSREVVEATESAGAAEGTESVGAAEAVEVAENAEGAGAVGASASFAASVHGAENGVGNVSRETFSVDPAAQEAPSTDSAESAPKELPVPERKTVASLHNTVSRETFPRDGEVAASAGEGGEGGLAHAGDGGGAGIGGRKLLVGAGIGMLAGVASGYVGIGGGFLMVPMMLQLLHLPMRLTSGTSLLAVMILAVPGVVMQASLGNVDWVAGLLVALGTMPGAFFGARLITRLPERTLRFIFSGFLLVAAVMLMLDQFNIL